MDIHSLIRDGFFLKSNKKEIGVFKSIIIGLLLTIVAAIPSMILYGLYSQ